MNKAILEIKHLSVCFETGQQRVTAVDDVSFSLAQGEILGIVGESGSGKSTLAYSVLNMIPQPHGKLIGGEVNYKGQDLLTCRHINQIRGKEITMVMQNAMSVLDPAFTIGYQLVEHIRVKSALRKQEAYSLAAELLTLLEFDQPNRIMRSYPHQLSGGMRQRVLIALAIANQPSVIIADEPTTALDVIVQKKIIQLMKKIVVQRNISLILITHNFGLVWEICDRALVMRQGKVVESADVDELYHHPIHPYTRGLLKSIPTFDSNPASPLPTVEEEIRTCAALTRPPDLAPGHYVLFEEERNPHV